MPEGLLSDERNSFNEVTYPDVNSVDLGAVSSQPISIQSAYPVQLKKTPYTNEEIALKNTPPEKQPTIVDAYLEIEGPVPADGTGRRLEFASLPVDISETTAAMYQPITILGRSEPLRVYGSTGVRTWNLDLMFCAHSSEYNDVVRKINWCRSLCYPRYRQGICIGPPTVRLCLGFLINVRTICTSITPSWRTPWSIGLDGRLGYPMQAGVALTLEKISDTPPTFEDVFSGKDNHLL